MICIGHRGAAGYEPENTVRSIRRALELGAQSLNPRHSTITGELVASVHDAGMKVLAYTVNAEKDIERMRKLGVDGVFCDFPDRVRRTT